MNISDLQRYASLIARAYMLEERLRKNPPTDPDEYVALVGEIKDIYNEAHDLITGGDLTPEDIEQAHESNQTMWADTKAKTSKPAAKSTKNKK